VIAARIESAPLYPLQVLDRSRDLCLQLYEKELFRETSYLKLYKKHDRQMNKPQLAALAGLYAWRDRIARSVTKASSLYHRFDGNSFVSRSEVQKRGNVNSMSQVDTCKKVARTLQEQTTRTSFQQIELHAIRF
jgi:ribonuclease D